MASLKVSVDTSEVDRIAIGTRLYDMLDGSNPFNKLHRDDNGWYMNEEDIKDMFNLVNARWAGTIGLRIEKRQDKEG